jgi:mono/diheme cytochrome c family protein
MLVSSLLVDTACGGKAHSNERPQATLEPGESSMLDEPESGAQAMEPPEPRASEDPSLSEVARMEALLLESCGTCHGPPSPEFCGTCDGLFFINDMQRLIDEGKIIPCDWAGSRLGQYISEGWMPPSSSGVPPMSATDQARLASFVDGMCNNLTNGGPSDVERIASETLLRQSCGECHGAGSADGGPPAGGIGNIDDIGSLIERGLVTPCVGSRILGAMRDRAMPPPGSDAPWPSYQEMTNFEKFIARPCKR